MRTLRRSLLALSSFALLLGVGAAPAAAIAPSPSGWVVVRNPSVASYHPAARDRGNSTGGDVTVIHPSPGVYTVIWAGLAAAGGGDLQVSALGSKMRHCVAYTWGENSPDGYGEIYCYKRTNVAANDYAELVDSPFVAVLVGEDGPVTGNPGRMGYAWMNIKTGSGIPDSQYNYTNPGGQLSSTNTGTGSYVVTVPGVAKADGVPLVTGYVGSPSRCQVRGWNLDGSDVKVKVDCVDLRGTLTDEKFDFLYLRRLGLEGYGGTVGATLWANNPTAASYHPNATFAWSTSHKSATIKRISKGVYAVTLPGMPAGGAAIVSAQGSKTKPRNCQIGSIRTTGTPQKIVVRCFAYNGTPADSRFTLGYTH